MAQGDGPLYGFAGRMLDLRRGILAAADGPIDLRPKSLAVLVHLVRNAGRVIGRDELLTTVWPDVIVGEDSLTQCVRDLRRAIGDEAQTLVCTIARRGYLFDAAALELGDDPSPAAVESGHMRPLLDPRLPRVAVLPFALDGLAFTCLLDGDPEVAADWGRAALRLNPRYTPRTARSLPPSAISGGGTRPGPSWGNSAGWSSASRSPASPAPRSTGSPAASTSSPTGCGRPDFPTSAPQVAFGPRRMRMRERTLRHCSAAAASPCSSQAFAFWAASYSARSPWAEYSRRA
jgi:DNA-binding winged helix-turn-helix (wHTH) protein